MASRPLNNGFVLNTSLDFNGTNPTTQFPADAAGIVRDELDDVVGLRRFILVKNASAADIVLGDALVFVDAYKTQVAPYATAIAAPFSFSIGAALNRACGVAVGTISAGHYGWVQIAGYCPKVKANGAVANGQQLTLDNTATKMVAPVALGTAAPYKVLGTAVAAAADGFVAAQLG